MTVDWCTVYVGVKRGLKPVGLVLVFWLAFMNLR